MFRTLSKSTAVLQHESRRCYSGKVSSIFRPSMFEDKVAIVTGGGTGIGRAITQELLYLGCNVMIASRKLDRLHLATNEIRESLPKGNTAKLETIQCNIRDEEQVEAMVSQTMEKFNRCDFLVNNGGGQFMGPASEFTLKGWKAVIETNLTGTFLCCREVYKQWMGENGGAIVNMIANMWLGWPRSTHSGASRAAVENMTKSLAVEWAPNGIRLNAVAPGSSIFSETAASNYPEGVKIFTNNIPRIPAKRLGTPEEVSSAICFLLSPAAAFITGETIKIDGAQSLYSTSIPYEAPDHKRSVAYTWESDVAELKKRNLKH